MNIEYQKIQQNRNQRTKIDHSFVICAYGECEYLEECVLSVLDQDVESTVLMITSTPNDKISRIAHKYRILLFENCGEKGITQDWNFALSKVQTKYATIAHQDDVYESDYSIKLFRAMEDAEEPLIGFSDYSEIHNAEVRESQLTKIKRFMLLPLKVHCLQKSRFIRRRVLSFGCAICCPSVMFCLDSLRQPIFGDKYICCEDWEAWEKISHQKGSFVYAPYKLMRHRIHDDSVTTKTVNSVGRREEDYQMYRKFWPEWVAKLLIKQYSKAEGYNKV